MKTKTSKMCIKKKQEITILQFQFDSTFYKPHTQIYHLLYSLNLFVIYDFPLGNFLIEIVKDYFELQMDLFGLNILYIAPVIDLPNPKIYNFCVKKHNFEKL